MAMFEPPDRGRDTGAPRRGRAHAVHRAARRRSRPPWSSGCSRRERHTRSEQPLRLDPVGLVLATAGLTGVVYALVEGRQQDWAAWIWTVGAAGLAVLAAFVGQQVRRERVSGSALLPMRLFSDRGFSAGLVTQGAFQGSLAGFALVLTVYLQTGLGWSAIHAGLTLLPFSLGAFVGTGISVPLGMKLGKVVMVAGAALQSAATVWVLAIGARPGRRSVDVGPRAGARRRRDRARSARRPAGRRRAGHDAHDRGRRRVGRLRHRPAGRGRLGVADHRDRVLRRRRHVVRRGVAAVGPASPPAGSRPAATPSRALASLLLPSRAQVHAHQEAVERELALADPERDLTA